MQRYYNLQMLSLIGKDKRNAKIVSVCMYTVNMNCIRAMEYSSTFKAYGKIDSYMRDHIALFIQSVKPLLSTYLYNSFQGQ